MKKIYSKKRNKVIPKKKKQENLKKEIKIKQEDLKKER